MAIHFEQGRYWGKVTKQAMGCASTGNPQFVLSFQVVGKIDPANPDGDLLACPQFERTVFRTITEKTIDWMMKDVKYLCEKGNLSPAIDGFEFLDPATPGFIDFTNVEFEAYCEHGVNQNGEPRENWGIANGSGGLEVKPLESKAMRQLNAMFGKQLKSLRGDAQAAPARSTRSTKAATATAEKTPAAVNNDDIPF